MEIPYEVTARRDTGLYNAKIGVWLFLASEVMLFGGLFSAYVFLRVGTQPGIDNPWPLGINVQTVAAGFINTLVLIASSVFVVFAWVALKERKWNVFRNWMIAVIACAGVFMVIKFFEYKSKLTKHHDIKLVDNAILGGTILEGSDRIRFDAESVIVELTGGAPGFMSQVESESDVAFTIGEGERAGETLKMSEIRPWFNKERRRTLRELTEMRRMQREGTWKDSGKKPPLTKITLTGNFRLLANPRKIASRDESTLNYRDRTVVKGALVDDTIKFELHTVNLQMVPLQDQESTLAWEIIRESVGDDHVRENVIALRDEKIDEFREYFDDGVIPARVLQGPAVNFHNIHDHPEHKHDEKEGSEKHAALALEPHPGDFGSEEEGDHAGEKSEDHGHGDDHHVVIDVPRDQTTFVTNHGPRAGTYYAIYFTMTGLHGLHVIGGALVLAYFVLFGKKLFLRNPEHMANRVEVGGLFWHFVDLVWIFLFPIMYLM